MPATSDLFRYKEANLHYSVFGHGEKVMLAFHGYGQTNHALRQLEKTLQDYKVYAFDLFYHGESFWHSPEKPLTKEFWADLIEAFLKEKEIESFALLGFSMGGKLVLSTLEKFPHKVNEIILIAPDGIKTNFWYNLVTLPGLFRSMFRRLVVKPQFYFNLTKTLSKLKVVDKGVVRFAENQMKTRKQRRRVYYSWMVFRKLKFKLNYLSLLINRYNIPLTIFLGKYDKIITLDIINMMFKRVKKSNVHLLKAGHSNLIGAVVEFYKNKDEK